VQLPVCAAAGYVHVGVHVRVSVSVKSVWASRLMSAMLASARGDGAGASAVTCELCMQRVQHCAHRGARHNGSHLWSIGIHAGSMNQ